MKITVAICTWNRARLLDQTLESLSQMKVPASLDWEVVVVDNNSTEHAVPLVLNGWRKILPLKTAIEREVGHSAARNRAVSMAEGDYIVWTDNDVHVAENWLVAYRNAFREYPDHAFFGGPIRPVFESGQPEWIRQTWNICGPVYAERDLGSESRDLDTTTLPYGANFAVRADVQRNFPYDVRLGRKKSGMIGEDEVSVMRKILDAGHSGRWVPDASLEHVIPDDRATREYVASYYHAQGIVNALKGKIRRSRLRIRFDAFWSQLGYRVHYLVSKPQTWVARLVHAAICRGELDGLRLGSSGSDPNGSR